MKLASTILNNNPYLRYTLNIYGKYSPQSNPPLSTFIAFSHAGLAWPKGGFADKRPSRGAEIPIGRQQQGT
jgi:hypothetical protein